MKRLPPPVSFAIEWACYLEQRGHCIWQWSVSPDILRSRNGRACKYRWVLVHGQRSRRRLSPIERQHLLNQIHQGKTAGELVFVVVKFDRPVEKVVVMRAEKAASLPVISADKGGIPWPW